MLPPGECNYIVLNWVIRLHSLGSTFCFDESLTETAPNVYSAFSFETHMWNYVRTLWSSCGVYAIHLSHYYNTNFSSRLGVFRSGAAVWRMHLHRFQLNYSSALTRGQIIFRPVLNRNSSKCMLGIFFRNAHAQLRENTMKFMRRVCNSSLLIL